MKKHLAAAAAALAALAAAAAPARAQTGPLADALVKAYQSNPSLKAARARARAADEIVIQAFSVLMPNVEASGNYGRRWREEGGASRTLVADPARGALTVRQFVYGGGRAAAGVAAARGDARAGRAQLSATEQRIFLQTATAYADLARDRAVLGLNVNNEKVLARQLEATRDRFRVGEVTRTSVSQAESRLARAGAARIAAEGALVDSRAAFANLVGEAAGAATLPEPLGGLPASLEDATAEAREANFDVLRARFAEQAAEASIRRVEGELLPQVTLAGELANSDEFGASLQRNRVDLSLTARVTMPLYASGSIRSRVRQARQLRAQRRQEHEQALRNMEEAVTEAWQQLMTVRARIKALVVGVETAEVALEGVRHEASIGSRTVLDVLDAEQELLDARVSLVRARRDEVVGSWRLRQALGSLTAAKLELPVEPYDADAYARGVDDTAWLRDLFEGR